MEKVFDSGNVVVEEGGNEKFIPDLTSSKVKPLTNKELRSVMTDVSTFYDKCSNDVKFILGQCPSR